MATATGEAAAASSAAAPESSASGGGIGTTPCHTRGALNAEVFAGLEQETSVFSHIGGRKAQEDRFCICPKLDPDLDQASFYGVFDGTVGDFASDTVKDLVIPKLKATQGFKSYLASKKNGDADKEKYKEFMEQAMKEMYLSSDEELLRLAGLSEKPQHYAASTSVTLMLWEEMICVGHLGDSRICLVYVNAEPLKSLQQNNGNAKKELLSRDIPESIVQGNFVTNDHKPDQPDERFRIEQNGGSVEYLHNHQNKPFIRGGDFQQRKLLGESPMQLQYSRAFGGKDLKPFGLISEPTISVTNKSEHFLGFILASDGLWDVINADQAAQISMKAYLRKESPAEQLVKSALHTTCDNITAVTVFFDKIGGGVATTTTATAAK